MQSYKQLYGACRRVTRTLDRELADIERSNKAIAGDDRRCGSVHRLLSGTVAHHARDSLCRATAALRQLRNDYYCAGRAATLGMDVSDFRAHLCQLCLGWLGESERLSFQASEIHAGTSPAGNDLAEPLHRSRLAEVITNLNNTLRLLGKQLNQEATPPERIKISSSGWSVASLRAAELRRAAGEQLGQAQATLRLARTRKNRLRAHFSKSLGLSLDSFTVLQLLLCRHHLGHAEWLIYQASGESTRT